MAPRLPQGEVTFLFTDIEGSTRLFQRLGDRYQAVLDDHNRLIRQAVERRGGVEVKTIGDAFFCAFADPHDALAACVDAQLSLQSFPWPPGVDVRVRMAVHRGPATPVGGDYVALAVHQAARLVSVGHGGQLLVSEAARTPTSGPPAGASWSSLGPVTVKDFDEPVHVWQLTHGDLPSDFPPLRTMGASGTNVATSEATFVGRHRNLIEVKKLLGQHRIVSVVGAGGLGKTRLVTELAVEVADEYPGGAWLVELADALDELGIIRAIALVVGLRENDGEAHEDRLIAHLRSRSPMLLVIDNCEHLLEAAARIAARISAEVPGTRLLTTSRAPLNVRGEVVYRLTPLSLPDGKWTAGSLLASDAVRLFVDRAVLADPGFVLDESTAESVVEIVRSLDGLPLAIELAAARLRVMSAVALRARLGNVFSATGAGPRDLPERQRTLRNLVDWTFNRLDPEQAKLARFLAVFAGGFALDGVEAFAGRLAPDLVPDEELFRLVDDSIVTRSGPDRYHLHEIIRQYGVEQLEQTGELDEARDCHLDWASSLAGEIAEVDLEARCRARLEIDNLRTAFRWALDRGSHEAADRLAATLCTYLVFNGLVGEARSTGDAALAASNEPSAERVRLLQERAWVEWESHRPEALRHFCEEALALAAYSDPATINRLQLSLGSALTYETRFEEAENHLRGLLTSTSSGMQLAAILTGLSTNALHAGRVQDAITFARQAIDAREHPTPHMALGQALSRVDPARALDELRIAYSTWREWDDTVSIVQAECAAAWAAAASGATEAFDFISEGLTGVAQIGPEDFVECIDWLARALDAFGKRDSACRLVALVHELAERQSPLGRLRARLLESDLNIAPSESVSGNAIVILQEVHRALLADCDTVEPTAPGQSIW